jgi:hypothetical protein
MAVTLETDVELFEKDGQALAWKEKRKEIKNYLRTTINYKVQY